MLLGVGMGVAFTPLTSAGIAGVAAEDAGAASGLVNVAHQLGGSLGIGILVTVFASASHGAASHSPAGASGVRYELDFLTDAVHGFAPPGTERYNRAASELHWERVHSLMRRNL